jgi:hypothetical protein
VLAVLSLVAELTFLLLTIRIRNKTLKPIADSPLTPRGHGFKQARSND